MADIANKLSAPLDDSFDASKVRSPYNINQESLVDSIIAKSSADHVSKQPKIVAEGEELDVILESIRGIINNHKQTIGKSDRSSGNVNYEDPKNDLADPINNTTSQFQGVNDNNTLENELDNLQDFQDPLELTEILELDEEYIGAEQVNNQSDIFNANDETSEDKSDSANLNILSKAASDKSSKMIEEFVAIGESNQIKHTIKNTSKNEDDSFTTFGEQNLKRMVCDLMRPMMKDWLDNNLPDLVEKIIREEIKKLTPKK